MGEYVDFKVIKSGVSLGTVAAARYGVDLRRVNSSHERGKCPLPTHPVGDETKSFSINVNKQVWICHSTACAKGRRGKKGGDVIELVAVMEGCTLRDAGLKLVSWFGIQMPGEKRGTGDTASEVPSADPNSETSRYGRYEALAKWVEDRSAGDSLSRFEQSAYLSVLGQMEELAKSESSTE